VPDALDTGASRSVGPAREDRAVSTSPHSPSTASPGTPGSHLEREILQQPAVWRDLAAALRGVDLGTFLEPVLGRPEGRVLLVGAGTSAYAGQVAAPYLTRRLGRQVEAVATTDLVSNPLDVLVPDVPTLVVSFARSGNSPESLAACDLADQVLADVAHLVLTCNPDGSLARAHADRPRSRVVLMPPAADDQSFAMTSSFTSMVLAALLLLSPGGSAAAGDEAEVLARAAEDVLRQRPRVAELAGRVHDRVVYLGSGGSTGLARECALKLTEVTAGRVVALAESSLGFRHGPKAALTPETLALVLVSSDPYVRRYDLDIVAELVASLPPGQVVAVSAAALAADLADVEVLEVDVDPTLPDAFLALPTVLVGQLLALESADRLGLDPDVPFPGGEVNRVVQGVRIHPLETPSA
jgi:tagatose-6-phosphate ketose/aldose isomerase